MISIVDPNYEARNVVRDATLIHSAYCPTRSCRLEVNNSYATANVRLLLGIIAFITYWLHPKLEQTIPRFRHEALGFKALSKQVFCLPCIGTQDQVIRMVMLGIRIV
jgi:hypothetical protein